MTDKDKFSGPGRYNGVEIATFMGAGDVPRPYLRRRWIAPLAAFPVVGEHVVAEGERLDQLAARYFDDPTQSWQICDAHAVLDPDELTARFGRVLRVTLPPGIGGPPHDE